MRDSTCPKTPREKQLSGEAWLPKETVNCCIITSKYNLAIRRIKDLTYALGSEVSTDKTSDLL